MHFIILAVVLIAIMFYKIKRQVSEINHLNDLLYIKKQPNSYVAEMDRILSSKQTEKNTVINTIQRTTGLLYAGRFDEVIEDLGRYKSAPKNWLPVYYQNLILALYFKKDKNKANEELKNARAIFEEFKKNEYYKEFIDIVYSVSDFYNGKGSKSYYSELSDNGANDYRKALGYYFLGMMNKREKNLEEAEANFSKAAELGRGSFIEEFSTQN